MGRGLLWIPLSGSRGWRVSCRACLSVCWRHWKSAAVVWLRGRHSSIVCCRENSVVCWELVNTSMFAHPKVRLYSQLVEGSLGLNSSFWTITIIIIIIIINIIIVVVIVVVICAVNISIDIINQHLIPIHKQQEYYEGSKKSEDLLTQARKTLEKLKWVFKKYKIQDIQYIGQIHETGAFLQTNHFCLWPLLTSILVPSSTLISAHLLLALFEKFSTLLNIINWKENNIFEKLLQISLIETW